jgi:hypothetical protein
MAKTFPPANPVIGQVLNSGSPGSKWQWNGFTWMPFCLSTLEITALIAYNQTTPCPGGPEIGGVPQGAAADLSS